MTPEQNATIIPIPRNRSRVFINIWAICVMMLVGSCGPMIRILAPSTLTPPESPIPGAIQGLLISGIIGFLIFGLRWALRLAAHLFSTITDEGIYFPRWSHTPPISWLDIHAVAIAPNALTVTTSIGSRKINLVVFKQPEQLIGIIMSYLSVPEEIRWLL